MERSVSQISTDLRLVVPVRHDANGNPTLHAYHTPISREIYEANFRLLRDTKVALLGDSARAAFAARGDAALYLRDAGASLARARGDEGDAGAMALIADLKRLTVVLSPTPSGWDLLPVDTAISSNAIDADDWSDAENAIVFFTAWMAGTPKRERPTVANLGASLAGGLSTSSEPTEWRVSSPTSTEVATSERKAASSVPS